jgi:hypothetical protein
MDKHEDDQSKPDREQHHGDDASRRPPAERPTGNRPNYDYNSGGRARDWNRGSDDWGGQRGRR